jgi:hypothetical protein
LLIQTDQRYNETLARVAEGERETGVKLQRLKEQFDKLFGGLSDRVIAAEKQLTTIADSPTAPNLPTISPAEIAELQAEIAAKPKTKAKQIDLDALNLAQLRQLLTPNGLPQRLAPGSRYRNRGECLEVLGKLQETGELKTACCGRSS